MLLIYHNIILRYKGVPQPGSIISKIRPFKATEERIKRV